MSDLMSDFNNNDGSSLNTQTQINWDNTFNQSANNYMTHDDQNKIQNLNFTNYQITQNQHQMQVNPTTLMTNNNTIDNNSANIVIGPILNETQFNNLHSSPNHVSYTSNGMAPVNLNSNNSNVILLSNHQNQVIDLPLQDVLHTQNIFSINEGNTYQQYNSNQSSNNKIQTNARVRKHLKDILKDENNSSCNNNQLYFNQNLPDLNIKNNNNNGNKYSAISSIMNGTSLNRIDLTTVSPVLSPPPNFQMPLTPPSPFTNQQHQLSNSSLAQLLNDSNSNNIILDQNMVIL